MNELDIVKFLLSLYFVSWCFGRGLEIFVMMFDEPKEARGDEQVR